MSLPLSRGDPRFFTDCSRTIYILIGRRYLINMIYILGGSGLARLVTHGELRVGQPSFVAIRDRHLRRQTRLIEPCILRNASLIRIGRFIELSLIIVLRRLQPPALSIKRTNRYFGVELLSLIA